VGLLPVQSPEALQEVAPVEDQVRVTEDPAVTEAALAVSVTVGAAGGGASGVAPLLPPPQPASSVASVNPPENPMVLSLGMALPCIRESQEGSGAVSGT
jgi:hypothetical protein